MKKKYVLLALIPLLMTACGGRNNSSSGDISGESSSTFSSSEQPGSGEVDYYEMSFESLLMKDEEGNYLNISFEIPDAYFSFNHASTAFKKQLAIASMAFITTAPYKNKVKEAYEHFGFDNLVYSPDYELEETKDTLLYTIGHKSLDNCDLINISISGCNYQKPWESNFLVGESGNHAGFQVGVDKIMPAINSYLSNYNMETTKVYINGYSRSAGVGNIVSTLLIDNNTVKEDNLYAYLLETPKGLDSSNTKEYKSIFNVINSADLITRVAPSEYDLKRAGIDIDINKENADDVLLGFDRNLKMPKFTPQEGEESGFANDVEFVDYIVSYLFAPIEEEENLNKDFSTRANYYSNAQGYVSYFIGLIFSLSEQVRAEIMDEYSKLGTLDMLFLLQEDGPYNFLSPIFNRNGVEYDADEFRTKSNGALAVMMQKPLLVLMLGSEEMKANLMRVIYYHTFETILPLLTKLRNV